MVNVSIEIILTYQCNFRCKFCSQKNFDKKLLFLNDLEKRLIELKNHNINLDVISILGGEIGLLPENTIQEYINLCKKYYQKSKFEFTTNFSIVNPIFLNKEYDLIISWDSLREQQDKVYSNILQLNRDFNIVSVVTKDLINKDINEVVNFYNSFKAKSITFNYFNTHDYNKEYSTTYSDYLIFNKKLSENKNRNFSVQPIASGYSLCIDPSGNYIYPDYLLYGYNNDNQENSLDKALKISIDTVNNLTNCFKCLLADKCLVNKTGTFSDKNSCKNGKFISWS